MTFLECKLTLYSKLSSQTVLERLQTEINREFKPFSNQKHFAGHITGQMFKITQLFPRRHGVPSIFVGSVSGHNNGSAIDLDIKPSYMWLGLWTSLVILTIILWCIGEGGDAYVGTIFFGIVFLWYYYDFLSERKNDIKKLVKVFE